MPINKIVILDNSVELYEHYVNDLEWERTLSFKRGGLTYLISNGTIKFYAYIDYFYRNCLMSMPLPIYIVDEKRGIDGEYDDIEEITELLDPIFPSNDIEAELDYYLTKVEAAETYQPIGDYLTKTSADTLYQPIGDYVTDEELAELMDDYYTKDESDARFQPIGDYLTSADTYTREEIDDKLDDKLDASAYTPVDIEDYYTKIECDERFQPIGDYARKSDIYNYTYSKVEIDQKIQDAGTFDPSQYYNKNEVDYKLNFKLDASAYTPVDISLYYTKIESDNRFQLKGDYVSLTTFNTYITNLQEQINSLTQVISGCCAETGETIYRWLTMTGENDFICSGTTKYEKQVKQQSTDGGITWTNVSPAEYQRGNLIETGSTDCGYVPPVEPQYRWKGAPTSDYMCSGTSKYYKVYYEVSYDGGVTWQHVVPEQTRRGSLIEANSPDCGYVEPMYRIWSGTPYCNGYDKVVNTKNQVSYDSGSTWQDTGISGTSVVEYNSSDCGYQNYKVKAVNLNYTPSGTYDREYFIQCNGSNYLSSAETTTQSVYCQECSAPWPKEFFATPNKYRREVYFGNCLTTIGAAAFKNKSATYGMNIYMADSIVRIEESAFEGVTNISGLTWSQNIEHIGANAFNCSYGTQTLNIPNSIKTIGQRAFYSIATLRTVTIGSGITSFGEGVFANCAALTSFTITAPTPPTFRRLFYGTGSSASAYTSEYPSGLKIYVPADKVLQYKDAWNPYADIIYPIS
jgi:hypothetical protein